MKNRVMGWDFNSQLTLSLQGHGLTLAIAVSRVPFQIGWNIVALETSDGNATLKDIFDEHSHAVLPNQRDLQSAIELAERYAAYWQKNRVTARNACLCEKIGSRKRTSKAKR